MCSLKASGLTRACTCTSMEVHVSIGALRTEHRSMTLELMVAKVTRQIDNRALTICNLIDHIDYHMTTPSLTHVHLQTSQHIVTKWLRKIGTGSGE